MSDALPLFTFKEWFSAFLFQKKAVIRTYLVCQIFPISESEFFKKMFIFFGNLFVVRLLCEMKPDAAKFHEEENGSKTFSVNDA